MSFRRLLPALFVLVAHVAAAQTFRYGYIKLKGGEEKPGRIGTTISGTGESIQYRVADSTEVITYRASDIEGFGFDNGKYPYISFLNPKGVPNDWIFVELIIDGNVQLIRRNKLFFVFKKSTNEIEHLDEQYRQKLRKITRDCPWMSNKKVTYRDEDQLADFVEAYNDCEVREKSKVTMNGQAMIVALLAGYDNSSATFKDNIDTDTRFLTGNKLGDRSLLQAGVDLSFKNYDVSNHLGLFVGAFYNKNQYNESTRIQYQPYPNSFIATRTEYNEYSISYSQLKVPIGFELRMPSLAKVTWHLRGGMILLKTFGLKSSHPVYDVDPESNGNIYSGTPATLVSFKSNALVMGAFGLDFGINDTQKIRVQFVCAGGKVDATVRSSGKETSVKGKITSINLMAGFVF